MRRPAGRVGRGGVGRGRRYREEKREEGEGEGEGRGWRKHRTPSAATARLLLRGLRGRLGHLTASALLLRHALDDADGDRLAHVAHSKAAKRRVVVEHLHAHRLLRHHLHDRGIAGLDRLGVLLQLLAGAAVNLGLDVREPARDVARVAVQHRRVAVADLAGVVQHDHLRREVGGLLRRVVLRVTAHVPTADVLHRHVLHVEADVVAGLRLRQLLVVHLDRLHLRRHVRGRERHHVARLHDAGLHAAHGHRADAADLVHVLQGQAQRLVHRAHRRLQHVERVQQRGTLVPRHVVRLLDHVVALPARDRDEAHLLRVVAHALQVRAHLLADLIVARLRVHHRLVVHLVAAHNHLLHAKSEGKQRVLARLPVLRDASLEPTVRRVDHQDGRVRLRRARDHVLDEVAVAGRIDDREHRLGRLELPQRNVDRDAALALRLQLVQHPRVLEGRLADLGRLLLELLDRALVDATALVDQVASGGGLAGVDVADNHKVHVHLILAHG
ncbi:elongation factor 1-alpha [Leishmania tarentolae]|uniref:Elongation factor 1-alpha n=1 Tax=Leishmania tarentolae TaxID=5689 RepID=A0A640KED4_LEITA|nr:elongation factor 1-alpha [Leishmania tarentolae]